MKPCHVNIINDQLFSQAASIVIDANQVYAASLQIEMLGPPSGGETSVNGPHVFLQVSDDLPTKQGGPTNWTTLSSLVLNANTPNRLIPKTDIAYQWIRVLYNYDNMDLYINQIMTVTADVNGSLAGKYFMLYPIDNPAGGTPPYLLYFHNTTSGQGSDPGIPGFTPVQVDYTENDMADTIAILLTVVMLGLTITYYGPNANQAYAVSHDGPYVIYTTQAVGVGSDPFIPSNMGTTGFTNIYPKITCNLMLQGA